MRVKGTGREKFTIKNKKKEWSIFYKAFKRTKKYELVQSPRM